ncbi:response regulator [Streptomyces sp. So13.3]|uniref:response regulator n=1 Tax=Streptomyces sp. So13.3 TaxID=2136173 RepID=UPI001FD4EE07|nr:response regulator [Streptomyces sp. So13.3]
MRRAPSRPRSLAGQLFAMQVVIVAVVVAGCAVLAYVQAHSRAEDGADGRVRAAAASIADSPTVRQAALAAPGTDPSTVLQPYAQRVVADAGVDFVTIMAPDGIRWTHPDPQRIGEPFLGHTARALRGETFTETYTGTLGPSVRVVAPVRDGPGGRVIALVSVGIKVDAISHEVRGQLTVLIAVAAAALAIGGLGTYLANARLRRHTHGMAATELSRMYDYHQATLHAVREGLILLGADRRVLLCNDAARELLGLTGEVVGGYVDGLGLPASLTGALLAAEPRVDEVHLTAERVVVVNTSPVLGGERRGTVVTLRDHTDLQVLTGELDSVRGFAEALRSQAHEASNRLHTVVSLIELGRADEAVDFATAELELAQDLHLPDGHGLQVVQAMRAAGHTADVIAVTSARDLGVVRQAVSAGVVQYLLKPFTFPTLRDRLDRWARFRRELAGGEASGQDEVDRALASLRSPESPVLPKGLSAPTLEAVTAALREAVSGISANAAAAAVGVSRITARRYLEHLVDTGRAVRSPQYGQVGRPELSYRWSAWPGRDGRTGG